MRFFIVVFVIIFSMLSSAEAKVGIGVNIKSSSKYPWSSKSSETSFDNLNHVGVTSVLLDVFAWQNSVSSHDVVLGSDSQISEIDIAVQQLKKRGITPILKLHIWIPGHWAGDVNPDDVDKWFANYQNIVLELAKYSELQRLPAIVIGTELSKTEKFQQWFTLIENIKLKFHGKIIYATANMDNLLALPFAQELDVLGINLFLSLPDSDFNRNMFMQNTVEQLFKIHGLLNKQVMVTEIGIRSGKNALNRPWESPEERYLTPDPFIQEKILSEWIFAFNRHLKENWINMIYIWCWYTNPNVGGYKDTDFTIQNKISETYVKKYLTP